MKLIWAFAHSARMAVQPQREAPEHLSCITADQLRYMSRCVFITQASTGNVTSAAGRLSPCSDATCDIDVNFTTTP